MEIPTRFFPAHPVDKGRSDLDVVERETSGEDAASRCRACHCLASAAPRIRANAICSGVRDASLGMDEFDEEADDLALLDIVLSFI